MLQPIIHVLLDFFYRDLQKWNYLSGRAQLSRTCVKLIQVRLNDFNIDIKQRPRAKRDNEKE